MFLWCIEPEISFHRSFLKLETLSLYMIRLTTVHPVFYFIVSVATVENPNKETVI